ncbi:MAG: glycerophosphodiester phosphodiesterase [Cellulomonas sp.]|nr:glycerophosphodiester phosphodiesterase [Actinomycetota bacterium]MCG2798192.1 glycerophosphodiester phosphodiesterase [Cellulomonas sp.]
MNQAVTGGAVTAGAVTGGAGPALFGPGGRAAVIGHRGSSWVAPQNTLASFEAACRAGADAIELDLQLTADGTVVVIHDDEVDATTNGSGRVGMLTAAELRELDAGSWFAPAFAGARVPLWHEVLELVQRHPQVGLLVELKGDWTTEQAVLALDPLLAAGLGPRSIGQSFSRSTVAAVREAAPELRRGLLVEKPTDDLLDVCAELQVVTCNPGGSLIQADPGLVDRLHRAGLAVMVWTLDEDWMWREAVALGVDAIITDRSDRLAGWLAGFGAGESAG